MIPLVGKRFGIEIHLLLRRWIYITTTSVIDTLIHANAVLMTEKFSVLF
jgi:phosphate starvation-inducible membrane PsiE